ncbi:hypothetical protein [Endozoicomonas euniceicola]|uniref:C2H2-type domain-containing protein n=1 Tax=Endozoicomonas euniceicola TaxID=1234143 RepID=A0ABY6GTV8_9GAMM|nr:hypothetical protein [Endozoicomonas euniceicola]UYM15478.1 hypothetical protein NX720_21920 [Endozoicomonas euniceicola]
MNTNYGVLWLDSIKEEARSLRVIAAQEGSSVSSRASLNTAAASIGGFSSYYQARQKHNAFISEFDSRRSGCRYCRYIYVKGLSSDRRRHESYHRNYELAEIHLGNLPDSYHLREKKKHFFSRIYSDSNFPLNKRVRAALIHIRTHFDRSLEAAINNGYYQQHPNFDEYLAMVHPKIYRFPEDVRVYLEEYHQLGTKYGPIEEGYTYWYPS